MIRIVEVGPRDGLQNESTPIPTAAKLAFIQNLHAAGLKEIEVTSFVSPKWVPQLADSAELWPMLPKEIASRAIALVPNAKGLERALEVGVERIALFTAASNAFTQKNINMTILESLEAFRDVTATFRAAGGKFVRGYVSTAFECPYAGRIDPADVIAVGKELRTIGVDELSIGDTIGAAAPAEVHTLGQLLLQEFGPDKITFHFHDTRGTAIANVAAAMELGFRSFDSSAAGLGGCPYAPGAGGNLATEDLVYFLERSGVPTGIDLTALAKASLPILETLGRAPVAKSQVARLASLPS